MVQQIIFYVVAVIMVVFSIMAVTARQIIRSAVYLLFVLLGTAGLYLLMDYQFLMASQIAVYAGGIMVLLIFSILLTHNPGQPIKTSGAGRIFTSAILAVAGLAICGHIIFYNVNKFYHYVTHTETDMRVIGETLMGTSKFQYMLPFEVISLLLLACIIGGIMIARKR